MPAHEIGLRAFLWAGLILFTAKIIYKWIIIIIKNVKKLKSRQPSNKGTWDAWK